MNQLSVVCRSDPILLITKSQNNKEQKVMGHAVCSSFVFSLEQKLLCFCCLRAVCHVPMFGALCSTSSLSHTENQKAPALPFQSCHVNSRLLFNLHFEAQPINSPSSHCPLPTPPSHHTNWLHQNAEFKLISDIWPFVKLSALQALLPSSMLTEYV